MSKKVIITKGLPASGKSTWAEQMVKDNPNAYKIVCKDNLREMLDNGNWGKDSEKLVLKIRDSLVIQILQAGKHVIICDTNLDPKHEQRIKQLIKEYNEQHHEQVSVEIKFFDVNIEECIKRDLKRAKPVGERVIRDMYEKYLEPKVMPLQQDITLPKAIIVDIDGTIAEKGDRSPYDWAKVGEDKPKTHIIQIVECLRRGGHRIIFLSGRDEVCREQTQDWLRQHINLSIIPNWVELYMRPKDDMRKDSIIKKELFEKHIKDKYYVVAVLDDRQQVVDVWRKEIGLTCLQVDYGNF